MKWLILILLFTVNAQARNWFPVGKSGANKTYLKNKSVCEQAEGQDCYDITDKDLRYWEIQTLQVDDFSKPNWKAEYNIEACEISTSDCNDKYAAKTDCTDDPGDSPRLRENTLMPGYSVVCTQLLGYDQMDKDVLIENVTLKASVQAADAAKATQENALGQARAARNFGESIMDMIAVKNIAKGLSKGQIKQVIQDYELIMQMLSGGAIATARDEVAAMTPDGTNITQADKDEILAALDAYLAP